MTYKLFKFGAPWCGQCKVLSNRLESANLENCEITEINVDEAEDELIDKFQIRNIPVTVLLDENDNLVQKWVGIFDTNEIQGFIKQETSADD